MKTPRAASARAPARRARLGALPSRGGGGRAAGLVHGCWRPAIATERLLLIHSCCGWDARELAQRLVPAECRAGRAQGSVSRQAWGLEFRVGCNEGCEV